jgi:NADH:ubiquinone oxidoreductase subunit E
MTSEPCVDLSRVEKILDQYPLEEPSLIQVLQDVHRAYNYLPCDVLAKVSDALEVPLAKAFSLTPQGDTVIRVCMGTACHIRGAGQLVEELERKLGIGPDETTEDLKFTIKTVNCVGACAMAPVMIVGEKYWGSAKPARMSRYLGDGGGEHEN